MMYFIPLILNVLIILYCIFNVENKYNIIYIIWFILACVPILNYLSIVCVPLYMCTATNGYYHPRFKLKPTKLNKFLFGYEERKD